MIAGPVSFHSDVNWYLDGQMLCNTDHLNILGIHYTSNLKSDVHIESRTSACRRAVFQYTCAGMAFPGLSTEPKVELFLKKWFTHATLWAGCFRCQ